MSKVTQAVIGVLVAIVLLGCCVTSSLIGSYNGLVKSDQAVLAQWGQVENTYQRRFDLIPNLVKSVEAGMRQEQKVFGDIAEARTRYSGAQTPDAKAAAAGQLEGALGRLLVVMENYPQLTSQQSVRDLMIELEGTENRVSFERNKYNRVVESHNTRVRSFPTSIMAGIFGFKTYDQFKAVAGADKAPEVDINN